MEPTGISICDRVVLFLLSAHLASAMKSRSGNEEYKGDMGSGSTFPTPEIRSLSLKNLINVIKIHVNIGNEDYAIPMMMMMMMNDNNIV